MKDWQIILVACCFLGAVGNLMRGLVYSKIFSSLFSFGPQKKYDHFVPKDMTDDTQIEEIFAGIIISLVAAFVFLDLWWLELLKPHYQYLAVGYVCLLFIPGLGAMILVVGTPLAIYRMPASVILGASAIITMPFWLPRYVKCLIGGAVRRSAVKNKNISWYPKNIRSKKCER